MEEIIVDLSKFTTCDVSDGLLNKYKDPCGGYFPNLTKWSGASHESVVGKAYTVLFAPHDDPREEINYIDNVPGGSVLVLAPTIPLQTETAPYTRVNQAMYGGLMSTRAQYSGARGTVVFGRIRDLEEQKALNYPVFSYGLGSCAAKMALKPVAVNVPLSILSIDSQVYSIHPGDYIVGDCHGIVRIPVMDVEIKDLIAYVKKSVEIDDLIALDAKQGKPVKASQKERRAVLKKLVE